MLRARTILILGIWTALLPFSGFPIGIKNGLFSLTGLALIYLSFVFYKEIREARKKGKKHEKVFDNFSENKIDQMVDTVEEFLENDAERAK